MLSLLAASLLACAPQSELDALSARLEALEKKVESGAVAKPGAAAAPVDTAKEEAATKLLTEVQEARKAMDFTTAKAKLAELKATYADTKAGKASARVAAELDVVGIDAKPVEVEKWYTKKQGKIEDGKATMLVFWEVWCPHCKREVPKLPELQDKWKSKGLNVVALTKVTKSATDESVEAFIKEHKLEGIPVGKEKDGAMSAAYSVSGIPAAAIVKDGKVVWRGHPAQLDDAAFTKLLGS
jgi:thiol-disulfide isomerase/thioredoxin